MERTLRIGVPITSLAAGVVAWALWVSALPLRWLDGLVAATFLFGFGLGLAAYVRGADDRTRQLAILAVGWNALGVAALLALYAAG